MLVVLLRALILYLTITFCMRLMGKRQLGELQPAELVITMLISNIASMPVEDTTIPMILGLVPVFAFVGFEIIFSNISLQSKRVRSIVSGRPVIVISDGVIDQRMLRKLRFSIDDLMESLRQNKVFDINTVEFAIVETTGKVSVLEKFGSQAVTPSILEIDGKDTMPPAIVISDGKLDEKAMKYCKISEYWVNKTLDENKKKVEDVFLMSVGMDKKYFIVAKER